MEEWGCLDPTWTRKGGHEFQPMFGEAPGSWKELNAWEPKPSAETPSPWSLIPHSLSSQGIEGALRYLIIWFLLVSLLCWQWTPGPHMCEQVPLALCHIPGPELCTWRALEPPKQSKNNLIKVYCQKESNACLAHTTLHLAQAPWLGPGLWRQILISNVLHFWKLCA